MIPFLFLLLFCLSLSMKLLSAVGHTRLHLHLTARIPGWMCPCDPFSIAPSHNHVLLLSQSIFHHSCNASSFTHAYPHQHITLSLVAGMTFDFPALELDLYFSSHPMNACIFSLFSLCNNSLRTFELRTTSFEDTRVVRNSICLPRHPRVTSPSSRAL